MHAIVLAICLAGAPAPKESSLYELKAKTIDGKERALSDFKGKAVLVVNTASECGSTDQYGPLEQLYQRYKARGFEVLAFPSNDFGGQEPGSNAEIKKFCALKYKTTFPLFAKTPVTGEQAHPVYRFLAAQPQSGGAPTWNFVKYLVDPDGKLVARFDTGVEPDAEELTSKLETVLPKK